MAKKDEDDGSNIVQMKTLNKVKLFDALDTLSRLKTASASAAGEIGPMAKKFEKEYGIPPSVLMWLSKLDRMSENKKADYVAGLELALPLMKDRLQMRDLFGGADIEPQPSKVVPKPDGKADIAGKPKAKEAV